MSSIVPALCLSSDSEAKYNNKKHGFDQQPVQTALSSITVPSGNFA